MLKTIEKHQMHLSESHCSDGHMTSGKSSEVDCYWQISACI